MLDPLLLKCSQPESAKCSLMFSVSGLTWGNHMHCDSMMDEKLTDICLMTLEYWYGNRLQYARYKYVLTNKIVVFWDVLLSGLVDRYRSFIGTYCCHVQINLVCLDDENIKFQWNIGICLLNYT